MGAIFATTALFVLSRGTVAKEAPASEAEASRDVEGRLDFYRHVDSDRDGFVELDEVVNVSIHASPVWGSACIAPLGACDGSAWRRDGRHSSAQQKRSRPSCA